MKSPELFARNYLIFRYPTEYILLLFPMVVGVFVDVFFRSLNPENDIVENFSIDLIIEQQFQSIDNYLLAVKFTTVVVLAFFICYRWSNMQNNGGYGFWLTLGLEKQRFYLETLVKTFLLLVFGQILGLIIVFYLNQFNLNFLLLLRITLAMMSHALILIGIALLLANLIQNPEISALLYIIFSALNIIFNTEPSSLLNQLLQSDLQYKEETVWLSFILSTALGVVVNLATMRLHLTFDIDL